MADAPEEPYVQGDLRLSFLAAADRTIVRLTQERDEARGDNAALLSGLRSADTTDEGWLEQQSIMLSRPHPGAALLAELAALRRVRDALPDKAAIDAAEEEMVGLAINNRLPFSLVTWETVCALVNVSREALAAVPS